MQSRGADVQHVTSPHRIAHLQRIRCIRGQSIETSNCISHLRMARRGRNMLWQRRKIKASWRIENFVAIDGITRNQLITLYSIKHSCSIRAFLCSSTVFTIDESRALDLQQRKLKLLVFRQPAELFNISRITKLFISHPAESSSRYITNSYLLWLPFGLKKKITTRTRLKWCYCTNLVF
jgi:hypothetical protein